MLGHFHAAVLRVVAEVLDHDEGCQWVSQWRFASLANALFPEHVLLTHHVEIENTAHGNYNKDC